MFSYTKRLLTTGALAMLCSNIVFAQNNTLANQEANLQRLYSKMQQHDDSTEYYSEKFEKTFFNLLKEDHKTFTHNFTKLTQQNILKIKKSADGKLKIYSWNDENGGTMRFHKTIYQYQTDQGILTELEQLEDFDAGSFTVKIHQIKINNITYYLPVSTSIYSNKEMGQMVRVFAIKNNQLIKNVPLFKTKTQLLSEISINYDFFSVMDHKERPIELIHYNDVQKKLLIPVVNEDGKVSKKNLVYELKGDYLQYTGIQ